MKTILELLDEAGYKVYHKNINSLDFGVPQMRERIYFVGARKDLIEDNLDELWKVFVDRDKIKDYLTMVAPVAFHPRFMFKEKIFEIQQAIYRKRNKGSKS